MRQHDVIRVRDVINVASNAADYPKTPRERRFVIIARHAEAAGLTVADLIGPSRVSRVARARWAAMREIQLVFGDSYPMIGRLFKRDHTSVMHGINRLAEIEARP